MVGIHQVRAASSARETSALHCLASTPALRLFNLRLHLGVNVYNLSTWEMEAGGFMQDFKIIISYTVTRRPYGLYEVLSQKPNLE